MESVNLQTPVNEWLYGKTSIWKMDQIRWLGDLNEGSSRDCYKPVILDISKTSNDLLKTQKTSMSRHPGFKKLSPDPHRGKIHQNPI